MSVHLVCQSTVITETGWLKNNRSAFLTVLSGRELKVKVLAHSFDQDPLSGSWTAVFLCLMVAEEGFSGVFFIKAQIPFMRDLPHDLIIFQRPHLQTHHHWGYDSMCGFGKEGKPIRSIALKLMVFLSLRHWKFCIIQY